MSTDNKTILMNYSGALIKLSSLVKIGKSPMASSINTPAKPFTKEEAAELLNEKPTLEGTLSTV
jgi:hypothetical protein